MGPRPHSSAPKGIVKAVAHALLQRQRPSSNRRWLLLWGLRCTSIPSGPLARLCDYSFNMAPGQARNRRTPSPDSWTSLKRTLRTWDNDFIDAEEPAFIEFRAGGRGTFHFGYVHCEIDWRPEKRRSPPGAAFTFEGNDEMDPTSGRGWAVVQTDGTLVGRLHFYQGGDSDFAAKGASG